MVFFFFLVSRYKNNGSKVLKLRQMTLTLSTQNYAESKLVEKCQKKLTKVTIRKLLKRKKRRATMLSLGPNRFWQK